jgi:hypothetical protein
MNIQLTGVELPEKAVSPTLWSVFVLWESEAMEVGKEFTQAMKILAPDGSLFSEFEGNFKNSSSDESQVKTKIQIPGIPIWKEGWVTIQVSLKGDESSIAEYKFEVRYVPVPLAPTMQ